MCSSAYDDGDDVGDDSDADEGDGDGDDGDDDVNTNLLTHTLLHANEGSLRQ